MKKLEFEKKYLFVVISQLLSPTSHNDRATFNLFVNYLTKSQLMDSTYLSSITFSMSRKHLL